MSEYTKNAIILAISIAASFPGCGDDRALTQAQFCELVRERVEEEYPGTMISRVDERGFDYVRGTGDRGRLLVGEEYAYYSRHPESLDDLIERLVSLVGNRERLDQSEQAPDQVRQSIFPVLKPRSFLPEAQARAQGQQLLYGEHSTGLMVFFVLDQPTAISFLGDGTLRGLGISLGDLEQLAADNLARRTGTDRFTIEQTEQGNIAVGDTRDGYDAARLISPILLLTLSRLLDANSVVVAAPRRDLLLAAPSDEPTLRRRLAARARAEYDAGPYALTPDLFLLDREGLRRAD
jgi:uncharacterized protein YtpQ (UPF0354 family)